MYWCLDVFLVFEISTHSSTHKFGFAFDSFNFAIVDVIELESIHGNYFLIKKNAIKHSHGQQWFLRKSSRRRIAELTRSNTSWNFLRRNWLKFNLLIGAQQFWQQRLKKWLMFFIRPYLLLNRVRIISEVESKRVNRFLPMTFYCLKTRIS